MIQDFSQMKQEKDRLDKELSLLKKEYLGAQMPRQSYQRLCQSIKKTKKAMSRRKAGKWGAVAAILLMLLLPNASPALAHAMEEVPILGSLVRVVTLRSYKYDTPRNSANIELSQVTVAPSSQDEQLRETLNQSVQGINADTQEITDDIIREFEAYLDNDYDYQEVIVKSQVLTSNQHYFAVRLFCYQGAGSGYQWNYYFTIDLTSGKRLELKDLFPEGTDYITPISSSIKRQMQERMDADPDAFYWLHDEIEELNFQSITDETSFYINEENHLVIAFNEGDVAPMYMGSQEFIIPEIVIP